MYRTKILAERITQWYPNLQVTCIPAMDGEAEKSYITQIGDEDGVNGSIVITFTPYGDLFNVVYEPNGQVGEVREFRGTEEQVTKWVGDILSRGM